MELSRLILFILTTASKTLSPKHEKLPGIYLPLCCNTFCKSRPGLLPWPGFLFYTSLKALLTFLFLTFFFAANSYSQTPVAADSVETYRFTPYTSAGIRAGFNVSSLNNFNRNDSRLGMHIGLTGEYRFRPVLGVAAELNYTQHGTTLDNLEFGLNYLQMPVLLTLHDNDFAVQAGVYGALLLKGKALYGKITEDVTEHFKPSETGLCLGLSYSFFGNTFMGVRFYRGFQNINKTISDSRLELRNNTLQVSGGYTF
jgi:hypothetical protein